MGVSDNRYAGLVSPTTLSQVDESNPPRRREHNLPPIFDGYRMPSSWYLVASAAQARRAPTGIEGYRNAFMPIPK